MLKPVAMAPPLTGQSQSRFRKTQLQKVTTTPSFFLTFLFPDAISDVKITGPTGVLLAGNSSANISCQATGGNVTGTEWLKDGERLSPGGRLLFAKDMSSVAIDPLQKEDGGRYMCQLSNPVSIQQASYQMEVNCEWQAAHRIFLTTNHKKHRLNQFRPPAKIYSCTRLSPNLPEAGVATQLA